MGRPLTASGGGTSRVHPGVGRSFTLSFLLLLSGCASRGMAVDPLAPEKELFARGAFAQAASSLTPKRLAELPKKSRGEARSLLARAHEADGRLDEALAAYQLGATLHPENLELVGGLAWLLHRQGLDDRARPLFARVVAIHPNNASGNLGLAEILRQQGDLAQAEQHYAKALEEKGWAENPQILRDYAELLADRQRFDQASQAISKSLKIATSPDTLLVAARIERRRSSKEVAYQRLSDALFLDPSLLEAKRQRALWYLEDGRLQDAKTEADSLLSEASDDALARWTRGAARARLGDIPGARQDLAAAAARRREHPFVARAALALLQELHAPAD